MVSKIYLSIVYSWFVRIITIFLPNVPVFRRFRGFLYSFFMERYGGNFEVSSSVIITNLVGLKIGKNIRISHNVVIIGTDISIGDNVIIGPNTVISSANHTFDGVSYRDGKPYRDKTTIGDGSWVGGNCTLLAGSVLPPMAILGAGSVLTKAFSEPRSLYAGVPAAFVKKLDKEQWKI